MRQPPQTYERTLVTVNGPLTVSVPGLEDQITVIHPLEMKVPSCAAGSAQEDRLNCGFASPGIVRVAVAANRLGRELQGVSVESDACPYAEISDRPFAREEIDIPLCDRH